MARIILVMICVILRPVGEQHRCIQKASAKPYMQLIRATVTPQYCHPSAQTHQIVVVDYPSPDQQAEIRTQTSGFRKSQNPTKTPDHNCRP